MDINETPKLTILEKISFFISKYLKYIIVGIAIIIVICVAILTSFYFRNKNSKTYMNKKYDKIIKQQTNYCSDNLKKFRVCDFYINSTSNLGLIGSKNYDYISTDLIQDTIRAGARYFEIEIFNNTQENDTIPVVSTGFKEEKGDWKLTGNVIKLEDFLIKIRKYIFSEEQIGNFKDPLFIYLNIKINDNSDTLDKIYNLILNILGAKLLPKKYNYQGINIAIEPICNLMNHIVLMSNKRYSEYKIGRIINCCLEDNYLKRVGYSKLLNTQNKSENLTNTEPKVEITTQVSILQNYNKQYYIKFNDNIDLIKAGFNLNYLYKISGSSKQINNTGIELISFFKIYKNRIILNIDENFEPENNVNLTIRGYDFKHENRINFVENNKNKLTIIYNDHSDYDVEKAWNKGCQFVHVEFQNVDKNTNKALIKFNNQSILLKPSNLRKNIKLENKKNLNELYPDPINSNKFSIDYNFYQIAENEISIHPFNLNNSRLINHNGVAKFSINHTNSNSTFTIIRGLNGKPDSMSIKNGDEYLISKDNCCYLSFKKIPKNPRLISLFKDHASFYPISSLNGKKKTFTIVTTKDREYISRKKNYKGFDYKIPHYLKYRYKFNPKNKIYTKYSNDFRKIASIKSQTGTIHIWRPYKQNNFYPLGDYITTSNKNNFSSILVNGFVAHPVDYELIWENKGSSDKYKISIWKPIPPDGYISLGNVVNRSYKKPSLKIIKCVGGDYVNETEIGERLWDNKGTTDKDTVSIWNIPGHNLFLATPSFFKPNEFDSPVFNVIDKEIDYLDRLMISKEISLPGEADTYNFSIKSTNNENSIENQEFLNLDMESIKNLKKNIERNDYKIQEKYSKKCLNLPGVLWSPILNNDNIDIPVSKNIDELKDKIKSNDTNKPNIKDEIIIDSCKDNKYPGTNFIYNNDNTIRFQNNTDYCITANLDSRSQPFSNKHGQNIEQLQKRFGNKTNLIVKMLGDRRKNVVTLQKCSGNLKGQKFNHTGDGKIKYGGVEDYNSNLCLTNNNNILRIEHCRENYKKQLWNLKASGDDECISKGVYVYIKYILPRGGDKFNSSAMPEYEDYDSENYHFYCKGEVTNKMGSYWFVDLLNGMGLKPGRENSDEIIIDKIPLPSQLKKGTKILARNGGLTINGFEEEYVMWLGIILKKINQEKYIVLFDNNSIELDEGKDSLGRPRNPIIKTITINNIRLLKSTSSCEV